MSFLKKWYTYQKERFPILMYGTYIFAIVFGVFAFVTFIERTSFYNNPQSYLMGELNPVEWKTIIPMFIVAFLQFLMVRIVDEFKDYEEDCKYRPYRPVPRGLIKLKELKVLFIICVILQVAITMYTNHYGGILFLLILWLFFAIMSKGFFIKEFLSEHILCEVFLDELLMPLLVIYLSSFVCEVNLVSIWKLLLLSYIISWIVEIARKVRCKEDEENGVKTYTYVFGIKKAMLILSILETILMIIHTNILGKNYLLLTIGSYTIAILINILFGIRQNRKLAKITGISANIYILLSYLSLGLLI